MRATRIVVVVGAITLIVLAGCIDPFGGPDALRVTVGEADYGYEATYTFGAVDIEAGALTISGVITNIVGVEVTVVGFQTEAPFSVEAPEAPFTVAPEESIEVSLSFDPDVVGEATGTLEVVLDGLNDPFVLNLVGAGVGTAADLVKITVGPTDYTSGTTYDMGPADPDTGAVNQPILLVNLSDGPISLTGATSGAQGISLTLPALPASIPANSDVAASISFDPTSLGAAAAKFDLTIANASGVFTLNVAGDGNYRPTAREAVVVTGAGTVAADGVYYRDGELNSWPYFESAVTGYRIYAEMVEGPEWYLDASTNGTDILYYMDYYDSPGDTGPSTVPGILWQQYPSGGGLPVPTSVGPFTMDEPSWPKVDDTIVASYVFEDADGDNEGTSTYQWYRSDTTDPDGTYAPIDGANSTSYTATEDDIDLYLKFEVTPQSLTGTETGEPLLIGPTPQISPLI